MSFTTICPFNNEKGWILRVESRQLKGLNELRIKIEWKYFFMKHLYKNTEINQLKLKTVGEFSGLNP